MKFAIGRAIVVANILAAPVSAKECPSSYLEATVGYDYTAAS